MSFILICLMLSSVIGVYAVNYEWEQNFPTEKLFDTDQNLNFAILDYVNEPDPYYTDIQTSQRAKAGAEYFQWNRTPIYSGNETWSINVNSTGDSIEDNFVIFAFEIPNADDFIINYININTSKNSDSDLDMRMQFFFPEINGKWDYEEGIRTSVFIDTAVGSVSGTEYEKNVSMSLNQAIEINNKASNSAKTIAYLTFADSSHDGIGAFAFSINIEIHGQKQSEISITDTIAWVMGGICVIMGFATVYIWDGIDIIKQSNTAQRLRKTKTNAVLPIGLAGFGGAGFFGIEGIDFAFSLIYLIPIIISIIAIIFVFFNRMNKWLAGFSIGGSVIFALLFAPFQSIVITPLVNAIWYGYDWTSPSYLPVIALVWLILTITLSIGAIYNAYITNGKSFWA